MTTLWNNDLAWDEEFNAVALKADNLAAGATELMGTNSQIYRKYCGEGVTNFISGRGKEDFPPRPRQPLCTVAPTFAGLQVPSWPLLVGEIGEMSGKATEWCIVIVGAQSRLCSTIFNTCGLLESVEKTDLKKSRALIWTKGSSNLTKKKHRQSNYTPPVFDKR
ncbi:uncharacterized protein LOC144175350 [Haemaphysalis longicornis]